MAVTFNKAQGGRILRKSLAKIPPCKIPQISLCTDWVAEEWRANSRFTDWTCKVILHKSPHCSQKSQSTAPGFSSCHQSSVQICFASCAYQLGADTQHAASKKKRSVQRVAECEQIGAHTFSSKCVHRLWIKLLEKWLRLFCFCASVPHISSYVLRCLVTFSLM